MDANKSYYEPAPFPPLGNLAASARGPAVPGKWEQRVWMVCFWLTFIVALWQTFWTGLMIWGLTRQNFIAWPIGSRFVWWFTTEIGFLIDNIIGVVLAPLALYAFAAARKVGLRMRWYLTTWLLAHAALTVALLGCMAVLLSEGVSNYSMLLGMFIFRVLINNAPICALLLGLAAIYFLPKSNETDLIPAPPKEPINPLA